MGELTVSGWLYDIGHGQVSIAEDGQRVFTPVEAGAYNPVQRLTYLLVIFVMFPLMISTATKFGWDVVGFCLPMAFLINQVYVLYFNSKPANISYLTDQYSTGESLKYGIVQLIIVIGLVTLWTQYVMPLMGFQSKLW